MNENTRGDRIHDESHYRQLTRNMATWVIFVSLAPLILINIIAGYKFHTSYREKVIDHLQEMVEKHKQNIDTFLNEKLSNILYLAEAYTFEQLSSEEFLERQLELLQREYGNVFVDIGVVNTRGVQVAYAGPFKLDRANYADAEWFKEVLKEPYYVSDVFLGLRGLPHFIIAIREDSGGRDWILRSTIDFVAFNNLVESIRIGKTGQAYILNQLGQFQTTPLKTPVNNDFYRELASQRFSDQSVQVLQARNEDGEKALYLLTPLKNQDWILVYQQDVSDAFSELFQTRNLVLIVLVLGVIGISIMARFLARRMVEQIKKSDQEKEMMNEQVIEAGKLASLGELAAGIAHEINNPVAIMVEEAGWMGDLLVEEEFKGSENYNEFERALQQIRTQGSRCKEITHKLLSFARKIDSSVQNIQLNDLIEEVVALSEKRAKFNCVKIKTRLSKTLPRVTLSPSEMQQVLLNMINNSLDAIDPKKGGTLTITTRVEGKYIVIDVADTGHGIPKAVLARIFDPFFTTKPVGKGTGLGLSICYGIIKKLGGDITVNSAVDAGTTFHIKIPIGQNL